MKLIDLSIKDFINEVDSNKPAPGGGSVSALASSLGLGLTKMVAHLTFGKKKYGRLDESIKGKYEENFNKLSKLLNNVNPLIDEDTIAFNQIMNAFKLPKDNDQEKTHRSEAIEKATLNAIKVPFEIAKISHNALLIIKEMIPYGNKNAITDIGVGSLLLFTGLEGALFNVKVNLTGLKDEKIINDYNNECTKLLKEAKEVKEYIYNYVLKSIV